VRNLFDRDPPYSNQVSSFQQGYDTRYADATGRVFYARANCAF
jgi:iron complex outermembrane receptor protein